MALTRSQGGTVVTYHKVIRGNAHPTFASKNHPNQLFDLGIAFRTQDAPLGYVPFYARNDFDLSGQTSFKEEVLARLPIDFSAAASPHTLLIQQSSEDPEFAGSGEADLPDIGQAVRRDRLQHAMTAASGVMVDGMMAAFGGPAIKSLVGQLVTSRIKQFIMSKSISAGVKKQLKDAAGVDLDRLSVLQR
jgi:hypothetical protein